jgi:hypothetical protein
MATLVINEMEYRIISLNDVKRNRRLLSID